MILSKAFTAATTAILCAACGRLDFAARSDAGPGSDGASGLDGNPSDDSAPAVACPSGAMFCDGFESGNISAWSNSEMSAGAGSTLAVQSTIVHSGTFALDATMPAFGNGAFADVFVSFPTISSGTVATRIWVYPAQPLVNFDGVLLLYTDVSNALLVSGDSTGIWTATQNSTDWHSSVAAASNTWTCVELDLVFTPQLAITLYINDVAAITGQVLTDQTLTVSELRAGVARADAAGAHVIIDDVVLAAQHIGCN